MCCVVQREANPQMVLRRIAESLNRVCDVANCNQTCEQRAISYAFYNFQNEKSVKNITKWNLSRAFCGILTVMFSDSTLRLSLSLSLVRWLNWIAPWAPPHSDAVSQSEFFEFECHGKCARARDRRMSTRIMQFLPSLTANRSLLTSTKIKPKPIATDWM